MQRTIVTQRVIDGILPQAYLTPTIRRSVLVPLFGRGGIILNEFKNPEDPDYEEYKSTHAEYSLVKSHEKGCPSLKHILVIRIHPKKLDLGMSRPCYVCQELLLNYGVEKVTYSTRKGDDLVTEYVSDMSESD